MGEDSLTKLSTHLKSFHPTLYRGYLKKASEDKFGQSNEGRYGKRKRKQNDFDYEPNEGNWNDGVSQSIKDEVDQSDTEKSVPKRKRKKRRGKTARKAMTTLD